MKKLVIAMALAVAASACDALPTEAPDVPDSADARRGAAWTNPGVLKYQITIENLTTGQPLSPGIIITHSPWQNLFRPHRQARQSVRLIAENGNPALALDYFSDAPGVKDAVATSAPVGCLGCPGPFPSSLSVEITASRWANRLSLALMLICTNDGFIGLNTVRLPRGDEPVMFYAYAYDAGTERNDETWDSIVDPCGGIGPVAGPQDGTNTRPITEGVVLRHPGITGHADLTSAHAWDGPVARVTVKRIP